MSNPLRTFIIYSRDDKNHKDLLLRHLKPLSASSKITVWHDGDILPGEDWELAIKKNIKSSDLILVLVSVNSLNSDFIQAEELSEALIRFKEGHSRVVPIIVDPCAWNLYPIFNDLQGLPDDMRPVSSWPNVHEAWTNVVGRLNEMIVSTSEKDIAQELVKEIQYEALEVQNASEQKKNRAPTENKSNTINEKDILLPEMIFVEGGKLIRCFDENTGFLGLSTKIVSKEFILDDFYIGKYPITQSQWKAIMGNNPSHFQNNENNPVENISWDDAQLFLKKLSKQTGKLFRLPTESEWEYAAKGGKKSKNYWYIGGNEPLEIGWFKDNSEGRTHEVGLKKPNELGIYDMGGNVWEWCEDWYLQKYDGNSTTNKNPTGAISGKHRVYRGGSWYNSMGNGVATNRRFNDYILPELSRIGGIGVLIGLRCVLDT